MDGISLAIGAAATKWVVRLWTQNDDASALSGDLAKLIPKSVTDLRDRGRAKRQFERLAEEIGARIHPILSIESSGIDSGEFQSATLAAQRAIEASVQSIAELAAIDYDTETLCALILNADKENRTKDGPSEAGNIAYESIIRESAAYVIAALNSLPSFNQVSLTEILSRETTLIDLLENGLRLMPSSRVPATWGSGSDFERFESRYRRAIFDYADRLQLFGVTSPTARASYSLSVAYIPLETQASDQRKLDEDRATPVGTTRVEEALSDQLRILLTGSAGGGKTTLLQWLATRSARQSFEGKLSAWNTRIPFIVQLRRYANLDLPHLGELVPAITPSLTDAMPSGWTTSVFDEGRALLLVDGFDEVSEDSRARALDWLDELGRNFPDSAILVTSRDGAADSSWTRTTYKKVNLLPMDYSDIKSFVNHWHQAALGPSPTVEHSVSMRLSEEAVLEAIRDRSAIRSLCDSPLLCALICALNRDSGARLPDNRMEIYATALQMLVVRRDRDRNVNITTDLKLNYEEAESILKRFAAWLQDNTLPIHHVPTLRASLRSS